MIPPRFSISPQGISPTLEEIFTKGFRYRVTQVRESDHYAVTKSLNGLQRFLDLPIEFFTAKDTTVSSKEARLLRRLCSTMLGAILEGYGSAGLPDLAGRTLLPRYPRSWAHLCFFLVDRTLHAYSI